MKSEILARLPIWNQFLRWKAHFWFQSAKFNAIWIDFIVNWPIFEKLRLSDGYMIMKNLQDRLPRVRLTSMEARYIHSPEPK